MNFQRHSRSPHLQKYDANDARTKELLDRAPAYQADDPLKDDEEQADTENVALSDFFSTLKISCGTPFLQEKIAIVQDNARTQRDSLKDLRFPTRAVSCTQLLEIRESQRWDTTIIREQSDRETCSTRLTISYPKRRLSLERQNSMEISLAEGMPQARHSSPSLLPSHKEMMKEIRDEHDISADASRDALEILMG